MTTLLHIQSSVAGDAGQSNQLARRFVERWRRANPTGTVRVRDLVADPVPHLDGERTAALFSAPATRSPGQQRIIDYADALLAEIRAADGIVLGLPMYNFGIPSQLKAYFDHLGRAGVTFRYTANGPEGLIADRPVYVFAARGGEYPGGADDHQLPYVKQFLGFIGLRDLRTVVAEGLARAEPVKSESLQRAHAEIDALIDDLAEAA